MQKLLSFFLKPQNTLKRYRIEMRANKEAQVIKQGKEQFLRLIEKGLRVPVALI